MRQLTLSWLFIVMIWVSPLFAAETPFHHEGWVLSADSVGGEYVPVCMANGETGILVGHDPFDFRQVILKSAFRRGNPRQVSSILTGINPMGILLAIDGDELGNMKTTEWHQEVDMRRAVHSTSVSTDKADVVCRFRALRNLPNVLLADVEVTAHEDILLTAKNYHTVPDGLSEVERDERHLWCDYAWRRINRTWASYNDGRDKVVASSIFLCDEKTEYYSAGFLTTHLKRGETLRFSVAGAVTTTSTFSDPWTESERQVVYVAHHGHDAVVAAHEKAWDRLWQGDIEIEGDDKAQRDVRFALFNLYSSILEGSRQSIAPMGLSSTGYNGHVFWDAEIWMFPPLLALHPELAREMLNYRLDRLEAARHKAMTFGYRGAMFPWESDLWGEESTPTFAVCGTLEHHITADIAIAAWNYYRVTRDTQWLQSSGYPLIRECARFWCDRVTKNDDGSYSVVNVVGANEYATGVTDNAFTNGAVKRALEAATRAARICRETPDPLWSDIAANIRILRFEDGTTREHSTYEGEMIKQADANLLGYPLGVVTDAESLRRDMAYYADRIDPKNGPAMSHSVFAVQYARLGDAEAAYASFKRGYEPNRREPYGVIAETATSMNPYFMTGAGGMLQSVIFGFGGLNISDKGLERVPSVMPAHWKCLTVRTADGKVFTR